MQCAADAAAVLIKKSKMEGEDRDALRAKLRAKMRGMRGDRARGKQPLPKEVRQAMPELENLQGEAEELKEMITSTHKSAKKQMRKMAKRGAGINAATTHVMKDMLDKVAASGGDVEMPEFQAPTAYESDDDSD